MSTPDREAVQAAMNSATMSGLHAWQQNDVLRANARDVAEKLRELTARLELSGELTTRSAGAIAAMADQLDPQPVSKP